MESEFQKKKARRDKAVLKEFDRLVSKGWRKEMATLHLTRKYGVARMTIYNIRKQQNN